MHVFLFYLLKLTLRIFTVVEGEVVEEGVGVYTPVTTNEAEEPNSLQAIRQDGIRYNNLPYLKRET